MTLQQILHACSQDGSTTIRLSCSNILRCCMILKRSERLRGNCPSNSHTLKETLQNAGALCLAMHVQGPVALGNRHIKMFFDIFSVRQVRSKCVRDNIVGDLLRCHVPWQSSGQKTFLLPKWLYIISAVYILYIYSIWFPSGGSNHRPAYGWPNSKVSLDSEVKATSTLKSCTLASQTLSEVWETHIWELNCVTPPAILIHV